MWNYNLNEGCSWQEILLSWARDMGAVKRTFLHPSSCSPPTDSHYLASETQNSAFGNQLVLGRWWESAVWWETWCLWCKLCCSWSKFLFSYVLISAKSGGKHHSIYSILMPGKIGLQIWFRGGKIRRSPPRHNRFAQNCSDWDSQTTQTAPNDCKGTEIPELMASLFCWFGAPTSQGSMCSSAEDVHLGASVCASRVHQCLRVIAVADGKQKLICCASLAWLKGTWWGLCPCVFFPEHKKIILKSAFRCKGERSVAESGR